MYEAILSITTGPLMVVTSDQTTSYKTTVILKARAEDPQVKVCCPRTVQSSSFHYCHPVRVLCDYCHPVRVLCDYCHPVRVLCDLYASPLLCGCAVEYVAGDVCPVSLASSTTL